VNAYAIRAVVTQSFFYLPTENNKFAPYIEIYWEIDPGTVYMQKQEGKWSGSILTEISIYKDTSLVAHDKYVLHTSPGASLEEVLQQKILELKRITVPEGNLTVSLKLTDVGNGKVFHNQQQMNVETPKYSSFLSDIQMVDTILPGEGYEGNLFYRNGMVQLPMSDNFLDDHRKKITYYAELYQTPEASSSLPCTIQTFIAKKNHEDAVPILDLVKSDTITHWQPVHVLLGSLPTKSLSSGNYYLHIKVQENDGMLLTARQMFFQLKNSQPEKPESVTQADTTSTVVEGPTYLNLQKTFLAKYTMPQIREILKMLFPIANFQEKKTINEFIKKPDDTYSRYFIYNFWLSRNKNNPEAAWKQYAEQVKEVNKLFGSRSLRGYETDRGIIYLKYGKPTERVIALNEPGALPYEVWHYAVMEHQSNGLFLFYRESIIANDFKILHSTVSGEVHNRSWRQSLFQTDEYISNSKAEQYFGSR